MTNEPSAPAHPTDWPTLLTTLVRGRSLHAEQTAWAMDQIMAGEATPAQIAGFATALRAKGETAEEVGGLVQTMLARATRLPCHDHDAVDVVGTGGDRSHTVNISTMAAIVVAGAGVPVLKHGNRAASSQCGAADLLEELGVVIDLGPAGVLRCVRQAGIGFCFAPVFHPALRHAALPRRELGIATVFNFLGPLANPGQPRAAAVGCSDSRMAPVLAGVFAGRGTSVLVFRGEDGLDELTTTAPSRVWRVRGGTVTERMIDPVRLGIARAELAQLRGADAAYNAAVARRLLAGEAGPVRDAVLLNAAGALAAYADDEAPGESALEGALRMGLDRATAAVDSGAAAELLDRWIAASHDETSGG